MPSPTLLSEIPVPVDSIDLTTQATLQEIAAGGIAGPFTYFIPSSGNIFSNELYLPLGINNFGIQLTIDPIGQLFIGLDALNPITLVSLGVTPLTINAGAGPGTKYVTFGNNTNIGIDLFNVAFRFEFTDNVGGPMGYNFTYTLFGFSNLSRGFGVE
jgi:hypothetical protein